jgi:hypothetical protein
MKESGPESIRQPEPTYSTESVSTIDALPQDMKVYLIDEWKKSNGEQGEELKDITETTFSDGSKVFSAHWKRVDSDQKSIDFLYLVDEVQGRKSGDAAIWVMQGDSTLAPEGTPFVANMNTDPAFPRMGLAQKRYIVANDLCKSLFGRALSSATFNDQSEGVWHKLIERGLAESTTDSESGKITYTFK